MTTEETKEILKELWRYQKTKYSDKNIREAIESAIKCIDFAEWVSSKLPTIDINPYYFQINTDEIKRTNKMKYVIVDDCGSDTYEAEYESLPEAVRDAKKEWAWLTNVDKARRSAYYVVEKDESGEYGNIYFRCK